MRKKTFAEPKKPPTLPELEALNKDMLSCYEISGVLKSNPYQINLQARSDAEKGTKFIPFPVIVMGTHVKIPRVPFINFLKGVK